MNDGANRSIVLTGSAGFVGAFPMAGLLDRGYHVTVLGRSSKDRGPSDRMSDLVRWFSLADPGNGYAPLRLISRRHIWALMTRRTAGCAPLRIKSSTAPRTPASPSATGRG